jgi:hypothetical protein
LALTVQLVAKRLLAVGQIAVATVLLLVLTAGFSTASLLATFALAFRLIILRATALTIAATTFVVARLAGRSVWIVLLLEVPECVIRKALLFAQSLRQAFHSLLAGALLTTLLTFGNLHILHHLT